MELEPISSSQWDEKEMAKALSDDELHDRKLLINLVRGYWSDALQDQVFLKDMPNADAALSLVQTYGVSRAARMIMKMNE